MQDIAFSSTLNHLQPKIGRWCCENRLRTGIWKPNSCSCGSLVTADGLRGLSFGLSFGRFVQNVVLHGLICRTRGRAGFLAIKEQLDYLELTEGNTMGLRLFHGAVATVSYGYHCSWQGGASYLDATSVSGSVPELARSRKISNTAFSKQSFSLIIYKHALCFHFISTDLPASAIIYRYIGERATRWSTFLNGFVISYLIPLLTHKICALCDLFLFKAYIICTVKWTNIAL